MTYPKLYLYQRIVQAKAFIDKNFCRNINVSQIAEEASYSKFHFIKLFHLAYRYTPRQYLIAKRIEFAKKGLEANEQVQSVCFEAGFSSVSTFSVLFKEKTGQSPSEYTRNYAQRIESLRNTPEKHIPGCHLINRNFQYAKDKAKTEF